MKRLTVLAVLSAILLTSCTAAKEAYLRQVRQSVMVSHGIDQSFYRKIGVKAFGCRSAENLCPGSAGLSGLRTSVSVTLTSLGYRLFDRDRFIKVMQVVLSPGGEAENGSPDPMYDEVPLGRRVLVVKRTGVAGVVSGRVTVERKTDDVTDFRTIRVLLKLNDAKTGALIWYARWKDTAFGGSKGEVQEAISRAARGLSLGLKSRLRGVFEPVR